MGTARAPSGVQHLALGGADAATLLAVCEGGEMAQAAVAPPGGAPGGDGAPGAPPGGPLLLAPFAERHVGRVIAACPMSPSVVVTVDARGRLVSKDPTTMTTKASVQCASRRLTCAAHSASSGMLAVGSASGVLRVYAVDASGRIALVHRSRLHAEAVAHLAFSPAGTSLAAVSAPTRGFPSGRLFFSALADGGWRTLGFATPPEPNPVHCMCWPDAGAVAAPLLLLTAAEEVVWVHAPGPDAVPGRDLRLPTKHAPMKRMRIDNHVACCAGVSDARDMPAVVGVNAERAVQRYTIPKELTAWSTASQRGGKPHPPVRSVPAHDKPATAVAVAPDGRHALTAGEDGAVRLWGPGLDPVALPTEGSQPHPHVRGGVRAAAFAANGSMVVTGGEDGTVVFSVLSGLSFPAAAAGAPPAAAPALAEVPDAEDAADERDAAELHGEEMDAREREAATPKTDAMVAQAAALREQLLACVARNAEADDAERLTEEELVVDLAQMRRREREADEAVAAVREAQRREALRLGVLRDRVLDQCWHSLEVKPAVLAAIKSGAEVHNFPVPREGRMGRLASKLLLLRQAEQRQRRHLVEVEWSEKLQSGGARGLQRGDTLHPTLSSMTSVGASFSAAVADVKAAGAGAGGGKDPAAAEGAAAEGAAEAAESEGCGTEEWAAGIPPSHGKDAVLYSPLDLLARSRRVVQVYLLHRRVAEVQRDFNGRFDALVSEKHAELDRVRECNARIEAILADLAKLTGEGRGAGEALFAPAMLPREDPGWMLEVADSEVKVERYLNPEERERLARERAAEEARLAALSKDNAAERALKAMLGGTLEKPDREDEALLLVRPEFMDLEPAKWTDEQRKIAGEYHAREAQVREEREKRVMGLETELRTMRQTVEDLCGRFDASVEGLRSARVHAEFAVYALERRMVRLAAVANRMLEFSDDREVALAAEVAALESGRARKGAEVLEAREAVALQARLVEQASYEDRQHEKLFKKEFSEHAEMLPTLLALFRRCEYTRTPPPAGPHKGSPGLLRGLSRKLSRRGSSVFAGAPHLSRRASSKLFGGMGSVASLDEGSIADDPPPQFDVVMAGYGNLEDPQPSLGQYEPHEGAGAEEVTAEYVVPLRAEECPPGLETPWWEKLVFMREAKLETDKRLRRQQEALAQKQRLLATLTAHEAALGERLAAKAAELEAFLAERERLQYDVELPLLLKQGQVEAVPEEGSSMLEDGILIGTEVVQEINRAIREQGRRKIEILEAIKEFKRGIYDLEWHNKRLGLEAEELKERTRELQLLRVTKGLQEALKFGGQEGAGATSGGTNVEKLMKHAAKLHGKRMDDRRKALTGLQRQIHERMAQNDELVERVGEMERLVQSESRILQSKTMTATAGGASLIKTRMRTMVTQARLRDIAQQQAEEIDMLHAEVDRLRARTFPTFVSVVHQGEE